MHSRALLDCFNEAINQFRPYFLISNKYSMQMGHHIPGITPKRLLLFITLPKKTYNKSSKRHSSSCFVGPHRFAALSPILTQFFALLHLHFQYSKHLSYIALAPTQTLLKLVRIVKLKTKRYKLRKTTTIGEISNNNPLCYAWSAQTMSSPNYLSNWFKNSGEVAS